MTTKKATDKTSLAESTIHIPDKHMEKYISGIRSAEDDKSLKKTIHEIYTDGFIQGAIRT